MRVIIMRVNAKLKLYKMAHGLEWLSVKSYCTNRKVPHTNCRCTERSIGWQAARHMPQGTIGILCPRRVYFGLKDLFHDFMLYLCSCLSHPSCCSDQIRALWLLSLSLLAVYVTSVRKGVLKVEGCPHRRGLCRAGTSFWFHCRGSVPTVSLGYININLYRT